VTPGAGVDVTHETQAGFGTPKTCGDKFNRLDPVASPPKQLALRTMFERQRAALRPAKGYRRTCEPGSLAKKTGGLRRSPLGQDGPPAIVSAVAHKIDKICGQS